MPQWLERWQTYLPDWFFIPLWEGFRLWDLIEAFVLFGLFLGLLYLFRYFLLRRLRVIARRSKNKLDDFLVEFVYERLGWFFYAVFALYLTLLLVPFPEDLEKVLRVIFIIVATYYGASFVAHAITFIVDTWLQGKAATDEDVRAKKTLARTISLVARFFIWATAIILILDNMGYDVTGLIAGLGIGGIAIGLAVQNILQDIIASFSIQLDRPFVVGDFIEVSGKMGTVEHIGIKTTRIRSYYGEEISIPNRTMVDSMVHNYGRVRQRRVVLAFGVIYETPQEKLEKIPDIVQQVAAQIPKVTLERVHFKELGDFSLNYETVLLIDDPTYRYLMDVRQRFNLLLTEAFRREGIEFAYPTQVVYVKPEQPS